MASQNVLGSTGSDENSSDSWREKKVVFGLGSSTLFPDAVEDDDNYQTHQKEALVNSRRKTEVRGRNQKHVHKHFRFAPTMRQQHVIIDPYSTHSESTASRALIHSENGSGQSNSSSKRIDVSRGEEMELSDPNADSPWKPCFRCNLIAGFVHTDLSRFPHTLLWCPPDLRCLLCQCCPLCNPIHQNPNREWKPGFVPKSLKPCRKCKGFGRQGNTNGVEKKPSRYDFRDFLFRKRLQYMTPRKTQCIPPECDVCGGTGASVRH